MTTPFPADGMALTHILVVTDIERARSFYVDVLGADGLPRVRRDVVRAPGVRDVAAAGHGRRPDGRQADRDVRAAGRPRRREPFDDDPGARCRGALTRRCVERGAGLPCAAPVESEWEIRGFFRDPDGHLIEISEARAG